MYLRDGVLSCKELVQGDGVPSMPSIHSNVLLHLMTILRPLTDSMLLGFKQKISKCRISHHQDIPTNPNLLGKGKYND